MDTETKAPSDNLVPTSTRKAKPRLAQIAATFRAMEDFEDVSIEKKAWLIHFTTQDAAHAIMERGFMQGTP